MSQENVELVRQTVVELTNRGVASPFITTFGSAPAPRGLGQESERNMLPAVKKLLKPVSLATATLPLSP